MASCSRFSPWEGGRIQFSLDPNTWTVKGAGVRRWQGVAIKAQCVRRLLSKVRTGLTFQEEIIDIEQ